MLQGDESLEDNFTLEQAREAYLNYRLEKPLTKEAERIAEEMSKKRGLLFGREDFLDYINKLS